MAAAVRRCRHSACPTRCALPLHPKCLASRSLAARALAVVPIVFTENMTSQRRGFGCRLVSEQEIKTQHQELLPVIVAEKNPASVSSGSQARLDGLKRTKGGAPVANRSLRVPTTAAQPARGESATSSSTAPSGAGTLVQLFPWRWPHSCVDGQITEPTGEPTTLLSWNVNSLRARIRNEAEWTKFCDLVRRVSPDIICLQEVRLPLQAVPEAQGTELFFPTGEYKASSSRVYQQGTADDVRRALGTCPFDNYTQVWSLSRISYSGQLVLVKQSISWDYERFNLNWDQNPQIQDPEGRVIFLNFRSFSLLATYVTNSGVSEASFRMRSVWDNAIAIFLQRLRVMAEQPATEMISRSADYDVRHDEWCDPELTIAKPFNWKLNNQRIKPNFRVGEVTAFNSTGTRCNSTLNCYDKLLAPHRCLPRTTSFRAIKRPLRQLGQNFAVAGPVTINPVIWAGDLNIALQDEDLSHPEWFKKLNLASRPLHPDNLGVPGCSPAERQRFTAILERADLIDSYRLLHPVDVMLGVPPDPEGPFFTWRGCPGNPIKSIGKFYAKAMRVDHMIVSRLLQSRISKSEVLGYGSDRVNFFSSDHCPILLQLTTPGSEAVEENFNKTSLQDYVLQNCKAEQDSRKSRRQ